MVRLKKRIAYTLLALGAVISFVSCASGPKMSIVEVTPNLITELGEENMEKYAFYLSKDIELVRRDYRAADTVDFKAGDVIRVDKTARERILLSSKIQGAETANVLMQLEFVNYHVLGIEFEEDSDVKIGFAVDLRDPEGRFYLQFDDDAARTITYGANDYYVSYKGTERPWLMVKIVKELVQENSLRQAQGKRFE